VHLNGVRVPDARRVPAGFRHIMAGFNRERILVSARWFGHMQHAQDWALDYAKTRHQFGRPIGANQSIAFMLAQNQTDIEAARLLTYEAADRWDSGCAIADLIQQVSCAMHRHIASHGLSVTGARAARLHRGIDVGAKHSIDHETQGSGY
jgi:alkylation response protein AidB-like acyl-CoA dehydrogenase